MLSSIAICVSQAHGTEMLEQKACPAQRTSAAPAPTTRGSKTLLTALPDTALLGHGHCDPLPTTDTTSRWLAPHNRAIAEAALHVAPFPQLAHQSSTDRRDKGHETSRPTHRATWEALATLAFGRIDHLHGSSWDGVGADGTVVVRSCGLWIACLGAVVVLRGRIMREIQEHG